MAKYIGFGKHSIHLSDGPELMQTWEEFHRNPQIKKTDIEIVKFSGVQEMGYQGSSDYDFFIMYDTEFNVYKVYEKVSRPNYQAPPSIALKLAGVVQTIPLPFEYVKDNFSDVYLDAIISSAASVKGTIYKQIFTMFQLMCDHFIDVEECKKTIAKHKSKGSNWGSRVSLKSKLNGESAQNKRLLEKIKKQEVDISTLKSAMSELEQTVIEKDKALQKKTNVKDEIQVIMLEGFESLQQKLSDKLTEITHKL